MTSAYPRQFFRRMQARDHGSAEAAIISHVIHLLGKPESVLDVGCGVGRWPAAWISAGVQDVLGLDGDYVDRDLLVFPSHLFRATDLTRPVDLGREFDLVESTEVAEHIPARASSTFLDTITRHGNTIVFSAAIPGQSGRGHVNEQLPSYWIERFQERGFAFFDLLRWQIWNDVDIGADYRQNLLIFARGSAAEYLSGITIERSPDVAHPEMLNSFGLRRTIQTGSTYVRNRIQRHIDSK